jgi:hypothetical protein
VFERFKNICSSGVSGLDKLDHRAGRENFPAG